MVISLKLLTGSAEIAGYDGVTSVFLSNKNYILISQKQFAFVGIRFYSGSSVENVRKRGRMTEWVRSGDNAGYK
jgi:hypothetical protein